MEELKKPKRRIEIKDFALGQQATDLNYYD